MNAHAGLRLLLICLLSPGAAIAQALPQLTPQEDAEVDQVLRQWESRSKGVKTLDAKFTRWEYDKVFGPANGQARFVDSGRIAYAAPDKGPFEVEGERAERWICSGRSIYEYNFATKRIVEHRLPSEVQGPAIANSEFPFLFGAKVQLLKQRYFLRVITPRELRGTQVWLEIHPRLQRDAGNFARAQLRLSDKDMLPVAIQLELANGNRTSFALNATTVNENEVLRRLKKDPFAPTPPEKDWTTDISQIPGAQASRGTSPKN